MFHGAIDNEIISAVVYLGGHSCLGMDHISEDDTDPGLLFGIKKSSIKLSFVGRGYNHTIDRSEDINGAIHGSKNVEAEKQASKCLA